MKKQWSIKFYKNILTRQVIDDIITNVKVFLPFAFKALLFVQLVGVCKVGGCKVMLESSTQMAPLNRL